MRPAQGIFLGGDHYSELIRHARNEYPNEACGILAGKDGEIKRIYAMTNTDRNPTTYFMDPKEQFRVFKEMRESNLELVGLYHSHVASAAYPSARDKEMAFYPEAVYLIISLENYDAPEVKAYRIQDGEVEEEKINIV